MAGFTTRLPRRTATRRPCVRCASRWSRGPAPTDRKAVSDFGSAL